MSSLADTCSWSIRTAATSLAKIQLLKRILEISDTRFMQFIDSLIGKEFLEKELFELLLFDIEERLPVYLNKHVMIYFERLSDLRIKVTEVVKLASGEELCRAERKSVDKREWFRFTDQMGSIAFLLSRLDRTGEVALVWRDKKTLRQDWMTGWADERPQRPKLTPEEIQQGFQELAEMFHVEMKRQKLRKKRTM